MQIAYPDCFAIGQAPPFTPACDKHDICYGTCRSGKVFCDQDFEDGENGLLAICARLFDEVCRDACEILARTYGAAVRTLGQPVYDSAQKQACQCCL